MPSVPLWGRGYKAKSPTVTSQKLTNLYRESTADQDKSAAALYGTAGLNLLTTLTGNPSRGIRTLGAFMYSVHGNTLYRVQDAFNHGTLLTSTGAVSMSDNGTQLIIVDGTYGYIFTPSGSLVQITDVDFQPCNTVDFLAGYFITDAPLGQFRVSALYNGLSWDVLDFFTAESDPDPTIGVVCIQGEAYILGSKTTEIWAPSTDGNVLRRVVGAGIDWGCAAWPTIAKFDGGFVMLAKNVQGEVQLVKLMGYQVTPLCGPDESREINARNFASATGFSYMLDGHSMYQLNFPDLSMLYDGREKQWINVSSGAVGSRHYGECRTEFLGVPYVTDYRNGNIYAVDKTARTDAGTAIIRRARSRHLFDSDFFERFSVADLYIDFETGVGLVSGQGSDPMAMIRISRDNGRTWGSEMWRSIGAQGKYQTRALWTRLGFARDFVIELSMSDPINWVVAAAAIRPGDE